MPRWLNEMGSRGEAAPPVGRSEAPFGYPVATTTASVDVAVSAGVAHEMSTRFRGP